MAGVFLFCQLGDTVCFICWTGFARSLQKNPFPGSAGISQASVQPQVDLFLHSRFCQRENKAAAAPVAAAAASFKNLQHTNTTNLSKAPYFFFFLSSWRRLGSATSLPSIFSFSFPSSLSSLLAPPTLQKIPPSWCLLLVCARALSRLCCSAPCSVIKAPLCAQPRTAVFE